MHSCLFHLHPSIMWTNTTSCPSVPNQSASTHPDPGATEPSLVSFLGPHCNQNQLKKDSMVQKAPPASIVALAHLSPQAGTALCLLGESALVRSTTFRACRQRLQPATVFSAQVLVHFSSFSSSLTMSLFWSFGDTALLYIFIYWMEVKDCWDKWILRESITLLPLPKGQAYKMHAHLAFKGTPAFSLSVSLPDSAVPPTNPSYKPRTERS